MNYFIAFCNKDSAIYNSYRGVVSVLAEGEDDEESCFFMPGIEDKGTNFFYSIRHPVLTSKSLFKLAQRHRGGIRRGDNLIVFNQGIFGFIFLIFLRPSRMKLNVIQWTHEPFQFSRVGFLRGCFYFFSDLLVSFFVQKVVVSSKELISIARRLYRSQVFVVDLPLSFDFASVRRECNREAKPKEDTKILFFGSINNYKNLDALARASAPLLHEGLAYSITMLGAGKLLPSFPLMSELCASFDVVCHRNGYFDAEEIVSCLNKSSALYLNYKSVTATSQIDIANYHGVPVIVSGLPYFREKVAHGVNGWVVESDAELALLLREILCNGESVKLDPGIIKEYNAQFGSGSIFKKDFYTVLNGF